MIVTLERCTQNPEDIIEDAARICYDSFDKKQEGSAARIIDHLLRSGHESVLEHCVATFLVVGVSRALTHQLVRHRIASYSQRSQRYVKETQPNYVTPESIFEDDAAYDVFLKAMNHVWAAYNILLSMGIKGEDARFVLPNACCTEIYITMNFRELRHFLKLRTSKHAQWEIRNMAKEMHSQLMEVAPNVFSDIVFEV